MPIPSDQRLALLIIDDDVAASKCAAGRLREAFPELRVETCDGTNPFGSISRHGPSLVVTDLYMPGHDGLAVVGELRRTHPDLPVIVLTARGSEQVAVSALKAGAAGYLPKNSPGDELVETVRWVLAARGRRVRHEDAFDHMLRVDRVFLLPNRSEHIPSIIGEIQSDLRRLEVCREEDLVRVGVALTEALTNAMIHGNLGLPGRLLDQGYTQYRQLIEQRLADPEYAGRRVHFEMRATRAEAIFTIRDEGGGFTPEAVPDPTDPAMLLRTHGRGLLLIRTFMDEVVFNERGNEVRLVKRCGGGVPEGGGGGAG